RPTPCGAAASRSTSSFRATIWSRASRSVPASRSFWPVTPARLASVSRSRSSTSLDCLGESASLRRNAATSSSRKEICVVRTLTSSSYRPARAPSSPEATPLTPSRDPTYLDPTYPGPFRNLAAAPDTAFSRYDPGTASGRLRALRRIRRWLARIRRLRPAWFRRLRLSRIRCWRLAWFLGRQRPLGRPAPAGRRRDAVGQPPRGDQESGVADHAMLGPDRQPLDVPGPLQGLPRRGLIKAALAAQRLHGPRQLGRRGDVTADQAAWNQRCRGRVRVLPRREHVQHHPVVVSCLPAVSRVAVGRLRGQVADDKRPGRRGAAEVALHVAPGDLSEIGPALIGDHQARVPGGPQQPA